LICEIRDLLYQASIIGIEITLCWIPSHVGIFGNELVDNLAKRASHCGIFPTSFYVPTSDYIPPLEEDVIRDWTIIWQSSLTGSFYKDVQLKIVSNPWYKDISVLKVDVSLISRMRMGHCLTLSHLARIGIVQSPLCPCGLGEETLDHIFFECLKYDREDLLRSIMSECTTFPINMKYLLGTRSRKVYAALVGFLKGIDRLL
jgi:hypothetical protein